MRKFRFSKIVFHIIVISVVCIMTIICLNFIGRLIYEGDYRISEMRLSNFSKEGKSYCNNCLWIEFYEGCNRYKEYYFENQHEYDNRLEVGMPVDISFRKVGDNAYIKKVTPRKEYASKC